MPLRRHFFEKRSVYSLWLALLFWKAGCSPHFLLLWFQGWIRSFSEWQQQGIWGICSLPRGPGQPCGPGWPWVAVGRGSRVGRGGHGWLWAGAAAWARVAMWAALFWVRCAHIPAQSLETANRCPARHRSTPTSVSSSCESQVKLTWALWPGPCVGDREAWALIRGLGRVPSICRLPCRGCSSAPCRHGTEVASWLSSLCPFKPAMVGRVLLTIQPL